MLAILEWKQFFPSSRKMVVFILLRSLGPHERNHGVTELETLGLVWAVRYFCPFLLGHYTVIYTDHSVCLSLLNHSRPSGKLARWAMTIQEMDLS